MLDDITQLNLTPTFVGAFFLHPNLLKPAAL